jgi:hypothetical protein
VVKGVTHQVQQTAIKAARHKYIKRVYFIGELPFHVILTVTLSGSIGAF